MSKNQLDFKIIEYKPIIPEYNDYYYQIICHETKFKDFIYCSHDNHITDYTNLNKNLKYIIKLMKKGKILGVGNIIINQELFSKKIKQKIYNNINLFITENNYKKIFPKTDLTKITKFQTNITLSIEVNIKYNIKEKEIEKEISPKKLKLMRRNFSYQERANNENSIKSSNIFTTSTTNINTFNNLNNCYDNENNNIESNPNFFPSDKYIITTPPNILSPNNISSPLSDSNHNNKKKRIIKKGLINNISFKNNAKNTKNKLNDNKKSNIFDLKNKINQRSSRNNNNKFLFNKKKFNILITQDSSSSKNSNTFTQTSLINSALLEKNDENSISNKSNNNVTINNLDTIQNILNNKSAYNQDNDNDSLDFYLKELENKKEKIIIEQDKRNKKLFNQDENYNKIYSSLKNYENKIGDTKVVINKIKEKNDLIKFKEEIIYENNKEIIPIISKIKESKEIETNIINSVISNFKNNNTINKNKNCLENNIEKYDKNLMIKMLKNVIQSNNNIDLYLTDENKNKMRYICDKYNIFGSIIEDVEE